MKIILLMTSAIRYIDQKRNYLIRVKRNLVFLWINGYQYRTVRKSKFGAPFFYFRLYPKADPDSWFYSFNEGAFPNMAIRCRWGIVPTFFYFAGMFGGRVLRFYWNAKHRDRLLSSVAPRIEFSFKKKRLRGS